MTTDPDETAPPDEASSPPQQVLFHYLKSSFFRVVHVDGVHGGITPHKQIQMAIFNERLPIPQQETFRLTGAGNLVSPPVDIVGKHGIVREVEFEAIMDVPTAKVLCKWLIERIEQIEKQDEKKGGE